MNDKTNKCSNESKCANCGEGHNAANDDQEVEKGVIKKMQADSIVGRLRAHQV